MTQAASARIKIPTETPQLLHSAAARPAGRPKKGSPTTRSRVIASGTGRAATRGRGEVIELECGITVYPARDEQQSSDCPPGLASRRFWSASMRPKTTLDRRWRAWLPEDTPSGAVPFQEANQSPLANRWMSPVSASSRAAPGGPDAVQFHQGGSAGGDQPGELLVQGPGLTVAIMARACPAQLVAAAGEHAHHHLDLLRPDLDQARSEQGGQRDAVRIGRAGLTAVAGGEHLHLRGQLRRHAADELVAYRPSSVGSTQVSHGSWLLALDILSSSALN